MERYGYIRVSSKDQNPDRQLLAMREQKIKKSNIYLDQMSGKDFADLWTEQTQIRTMTHKVQTPSELFRAFGEKG